MTRTLEEITTEFGQAYSLTKDSSEIKDELQQEFFKQISTILSTGYPLSRKVVGYPKHAKDNLDEWVKTYHPGWTLIGMRDSKAILQQDPNLIKYTYVNKVDGQVYGRTTSESGPMLDDERLQIEDPDLWMTITQWPSYIYDLIYDALGLRLQSEPVPLLNYSISEEELQTQVDLFLTNHNVIREPRAVKDLTVEELEAIQPYLVPGKISTRLVPPRNATEEELAK